MEAEFFIESQMVSPDQRCMDNKTAAIDRFNDRRFFQMDAVGKESMIVPRLLDLAQQHLLLKREPAMPDINTSLARRSDGTVDAGPVKRLERDRWVLGKREILVAKDQPGIICHGMVDKMIVTLRNADVFSRIIEGLDRERVHERVFLDHGPKDAEVAHNANDLDHFAH